MKKTKAGNSSKKKISGLLHLKDCLPPPVRLRSSYLKADQGLSEGLPKEPITPIEEVKKMLQTIIKNQNHHRSVKISLPRLLSIQFPPFPKH